MQRATVPDSLALFRSTSVRYRVLGLLSLVAAIAYFQRQLIAVAAGPLAADLQLSKSQLGSALSSFYVGYAIFQIPSGRLADVAGARRTLTASAVLWSMAVAAMALVNSYPMLLLTWFIAGSAQAGALPSAAISIRQWLPAARRGFASGALASSMSLGGACATVVAGHWIAETGWRALFVLFALPGLAWAVVFGAWFRNVPRQHPAVNAEERALIGQGAGPSVERAGPVDWVRLFANRSMALVCGQQVFRAAGYIFFATWFTTYLREGRGLSLERAGALTSLPLLAVVVGSLVGGLFSDSLLARTGNRRLSRSIFAAACMILCGTLIVISYGVDDPTLAVLVISAGSFCAAAGGVCAYTITIDLGGPHVATVFSTMNMCGNIGAALFPYVVGGLVELTGSWDAVLFTFAGLYAAAAVCWMLLDPNREIVPATAVVAAAPVPPFRREDG